MPGRYAGCVQPYEEIAAALTEMIRDGRLSEGAKLPPARRLASDHDVSVPTAQHALDLLRTRGLIETRPRVGTFVATGAQLVKEASLQDRIAALERLTHEQAGQLAKQATRLSALEERLNLQA
jgi:DNA-binding GntR family transcriptional regulator